MCGFAGHLGTGPLVGRQAASAVLERMADAMALRGPDDCGIWVDDAGIGLAHRRLSILDLSPAGHQPMACHAGRYVLALNGEIYNHQDLRRELATAQAVPHWHGHSDTETLLAGFVAWGIRATIERCIGMFAFAVWDRKDHVLTLGRDRLGEKPLYYGWQGAGERASFLFGSDLNALKVHPAFAANVDRDALCLLMRHNCIPAPHSIYRGVFKLLPAHLLRVSLKRREPVLEAYWSLADVAVAGVHTPFEGTASQATDALEQLLCSAVRQQMVADVPLGAFLSGGIDSSTVVALMQAQADRPIKTFSIGFEEEGYDEAQHARAVARHLGTEHTELYVTPQQAMDIIPRLPRLYSEPFADSSQIPTFLVSQLARGQVTVSLSGDAGDELFGGYNRYRLAQKRWETISLLPGGARKLAVYGIRSLSPAVWNALLRPLGSIKSRSHRPINLGDRLHKGANLLSVRGIDELYLRHVTHWEPEGFVIGGEEPSTCLRGKPLPLPGLDAVQRMMALDTITYLPDDILVKVDRAAMGVSLETRVPFLDHRVVEFAWRIPQSMKLRDGVGKWILRRVLYRHVPRNLIERPKMGFGVPIDSWLRGPLRDWAETLLAESRLRQDGYFNPTPIRQKWAEHSSGQRNWQYHLWDVLMFQAWLDSRRSTSGASEHEHERVEAV
ncbi:MAG: asparagine synthase (glutamine-hydrolyzing) [Burkholderiaceae bacterium]|nr:asparagine synthase (glutamine-hydrolyzing) [Burkholderiaceae bacterium]